MRSYFAAGYNLRELYITPSEFTPELWDILAEAALWAVYVRGKGYLALRNPSALSKKIELDAAVVFELEGYDESEFILQSAYADINREIVLKRDESLPISLKPREVLVLDIVEVK